MSQINHISRLSLLSGEQRLPALATVALAFAVVVTTWDKRRKTRKHLANLPDHLLKDVGVDAFAARDEASKPFWQG